MSTLVGRHDRAKASEHVIILSHKLSAPVREVECALPLIAGTLTEKLSVTIPSAGSTVRLPVDVAITPLPQEWRWMLELRLPSKDATHEFFEGEIRLTDLLAASTELMLVGRFTVPDELSREHFGEDDVRHVAEDNLTRIFESLLLEIDAAIAGLPATSLRVSGWRRLTPSVGAVVMSSPDLPTT
jgi:hypothetical protein